MPGPKLIRIELDPNICVGSGMCCGAAPAMFRMGPDGKAHVDPQALDPETAEDAAELCPVSAISLVYEG